MITSTPILQETVIPPMPVKPIYEENCSLLTYKESTFLCFNIQEYNGKNLESIRILTEYNYDVLIVCNNFSRSLATFLSLPIVGIVGREFLENHISLVGSVIKEEGIFIDPSFHIHLLDAINYQKEGNQRIDRFLLDRGKVASIFNERQQDILQLLLDGYNTIDIAQMLYFSISTVRENLSKMFKALNCTDRTQLTVSVIRNGWVFSIRE